MKKYKLLQYHMSCDPMYMFGHAIVAGKLYPDDSQPVTLRVS